MFQPLAWNCLAAAFHQKHVKVRGQRVGVKLPHHGCDLTSMVSGMVRHMLHEVRQSRDSSVSRFTNSTCSFSISTHFDCTAAASGNAGGLKRMSRRFLKSDKRVALWGGSSQYASQIHSPPMMWTSVSRTERKLLPKSRVN